MPVELRERRAELLETVPPVRIGLGYVTGLKEEEAEVLAVERRRGGPYADVADLAVALRRRPRRSSGSPGPGRCEAMALVDGWATEAQRQLGRSGRHAAPASGRGGAGAGTGPAGAQLSLPLAAAAPELRALDAWERMVADYGSAGRDRRAPDRADAARPAQPWRGPPTWTPTRDGAPRGDRRPGGRPPAPGHRKGVVFMLLEDELGTST